MSHYVIVGGHGKVALLLEPLLTGVGHSVDAIIRDETQAQDIRDRGANPVVLSVEDSTTDEIARAFTGADAVIWSAGAGGKGGPDRSHAVDNLAAKRTMDAAAQAGVRRYVMVSWMGSHGEHPVPKGNSLYAYSEAKIAADNYLAGTDLDWTILGPGLLTLDEPTGQITITREADSASGSSNTSRGNVARVVAAVLDDDTTIGKIIPFMDGDTPIAEAIHNSAVYTLD